MLRLFVVVFGAFALMGGVPSRATADSLPDTTVDCGTVKIIKPVYYPLRIYIASDHSERTEGLLITTVKTSRFWVAAPGPCNYFKAVKHAETTVLYHATQKHHTEPYTDSTTPGRRVFLPPVVVFPCAPVTALHELIGCAPIPTPTS
jgi:hypothetical protein